MPRIRITIGHLELQAELFHGPTAQAVLEALPLECPFHTWGDEFYFPVPVSMPLEKDATTDVQVGHIAYWPEGQAVAIFFGPTPLSSGEKPVPAGKVNIIGRLLDDATRLREVKGAKKITIEKVS
jgi:hypothetical protein